MAIFNTPCGIPASFIEAVLRDGPSTRRYFVLQFGDDSSCAPSERDKRSAPFPYGSHYEASEFVRWCVDVMKENIP